MNNTKDNLIAERDRLRAVNAQLREALKTCEFVLSNLQGASKVGSQVWTAYHDARAAIAQAEQGAKGRKDGAS